MVRPRWGVVVMTEEEMQKRVSRAMRNIYHGLNGLPVMEVVIALSSVFARILVEQCDEEERKESLEMFHREIDEVRKLFAEPSSTAH
jgi:hypothetical protein